MNQFRAADGLWTIRARIAPKSSLVSAAACETRESRCPYTTDYNFRIAEIALADRFAKTASSQTVESSFEESTRER